MVIKDSAPALRTLIFHRERRYMWGVSEFHYSLFSVFCKVGMLVLGTE